MRGELRGHRRSILRMNDDEKSSNWGSRWYDNSSGRSCRVARFSLESQASTITQEATRRCELAQARLGDAGTMPLKAEVTGGAQSGARHSKEMDKGTQGRLHMCVLVGTARATAMP